MDISSRATLPENEKNVSLRFNYYLSVSVGRVFTAGPVSC